MSRGTGQQGATMRRLGLIVSLAAVVCIAGCAPELKTLPGVPRANAEYEPQPAGCNVATACCDVQVNCATSYTIKSGKYKESGHVGESHWLFNYASVCMFNGDYEEAERALLEAIKIIDNRRDSKAEEKAKNTSLRLMVYRGEPYERCLAAFYCGLLKYMRGDYEEALPLFRKSAENDGRTGDDMAQYRDDFQPAYFMMGRTFLKLGQANDAEPAFRHAKLYLPYDKGKWGREQQQLDSLRRQAEKAGKERANAERDSSQQAARDKRGPNEADLKDPKNLTAYTPTVAQRADEPKTPNREAFLDPKVQHELNLLIFVETGLAPVRVLQGNEGAEADVYHAWYPDRRIEVYLDGKFEDETVSLTDLWHQANTRGEQPEAKLQKGKAAGKYIAREAAGFIPFAGGQVSNVIAMAWDITADPRSWFLLPGELHVWGGTVKPGTYTLTLKAFDWNNQPLPRYTQHWYYVQVPEVGERVLLLSMAQDKQNQVILKQAKQ